MSSGQELFQYRGEDGQWRSLRSNDVNQYLRQVTGQDFSAKDFRTWGGTVATSLALCEQGAAESATEQKQKVAAAVKAAARTLGNTVSVCRQYYVHPAVLDAYTDGVLFKLMEQAQAAPVPGLQPAESAVRSMLRRAPAR